MEPNEFIVKRFEKHNPDLLKLIEVWTEHSLDQNWDNVNILVGRSTIENVPPSEWDNSIMMNKEYAFLKKKCEDIQQYLRAKGYKWVGISTSTSGSLVAPDKKHRSGMIVTGYLKEPAWLAEEKLKSSINNSGPK